MTPPEAPDSFRPGETVHVAGMGNGRVVSVDPRRKRAKVEIRDHEWEVELKRLTPPTPETLKPRPVPGYSLHSSSPAIHAIDLHGMRVEDALHAAHQAVDAAVAHHLERVKLIHGHGTGRVRSAVREMLAKNPHVDHFRFGEPYEGGLACTIVILRQA